MVLVYALTFLLVDHRDRLILLLIDELDKRTGDRDVGYSPIFSFHISICDYCRSESVPLDYECAFLLCLHFRFAPHEDAPNFSDLVRLEVLGTS